MRVALHESLGHGGVNRLLAGNPKAKQQFDFLVGKIQELDPQGFQALATDPAYAHLQGDPRALALEWLAQKSETRPDLLRKPNVLTHLRNVLGQAISNLQVKLGLRAETGTDLDRRVDIFLHRARQAALRGGTDGRLPGTDNSHATTGLTIPDLQFSRTRTGSRRSNPAEWRRTRDLWDATGNAELLSESNRKLISSGTPPLVDDEWIAQHPEDEGLRGEQIRMHHVLGLPITIPLPISRHRNSHMPGGFRYNHGGVGSQLPVYH